MDAQKTAAANAAPVAANAAPTVATATTSVVKADYGKQVIERISEMVKNDGFLLPQGYSLTNAIKNTMLHLAELTDKNGRPFMEVCTPVSITGALFKMASQGLDVSKGQGYFNVRGNKLVFDPQYYGRITLIKRIYPNWTPAPHVVYEDDDFEYGIDAETGYCKLIKHTQNLANKDVNKWVGGYCYFPTADGGKNLLVMSRYEIEAAWSQSRNSGLSVHRKFIEKMVAKTLINSGATLIINPDDGMGESVYHDEVRSVDDASDYEEIPMSDDSDAVFAVD